MCCDVDVKLYVQSSRRLYYIAVYARVKYVYNHVWLNLIIPRLEKKEPHWNNEAKTFVQDVIGIIRLIIRRLIIIVKLFFSSLCRVRLLFNHVIKYA